jgi:hypothetical protein
MTTTLVTGVVGVAMLATFLGFMLWWVKALPLIIIVAVAMALLIYDLVYTLRHGEGSRAR